jgi:hypothetical protein
LGWISHGVSLRIAAHSEAEPAGGDAGATWGATLPRRALARGCFL